MCTYLDTVGSTYYFRRAVPLELRPLILTRSGKPRTEWKISLGTKNQSEAKRLLPSMTIATDAEIDAARERSRLGNAAVAPETPVQSKARRVAHAIQEMELEAAEASAEPMTEREARREDVAELTTFIEKRLRGSTAQMPRKLRAFAYLMKDAEYDKAILREQLAIARSELARRDGEAREPGQPAPSAPRSPAPLTSSDKPAKAVPLLATFDAYVKEQGISAITARDWRGIMNALITFVGHDDVARYTVQDIDAWRDALLSEKTKRGTIRAPSTVKDKYLNAVRSTINYAISKRLLTKNVAASCVVRVPRKAKLRERDFTADEAKLILSATLQPHTDASDFAIKARRWIPWVCAYTGARVNEVSQLRKSDVAEIEGIWTITITPEAGTVKSGEARIVPLHPHLIEQGFLAFIDKADDGALFYDPSRVRKPGAADRHVSKVGERLAAWVRHEVGLTDPNVAPNHGWRHLFKTRAIEAGVPERVADAIQGHAPKSVGQTYGRVSLQAMSEAVAQMPRFLIRAEVESGGQGTS